MHHVETGTGRPVLFVHGGFCDHRDWRYQVAGVGRRMRALAVDLPGHGATPVADPATISPELCAEEINRFIDAQGLDPCVLVGHSFGTRVVLETARQRPGNAAAIVLVDTSRVGAPSAAIDTAAIFARIERLGAEGFLNAYFAEMMIGTYSDAIRDEIFARFSGIDTRTITAIMLSVIRWDSTLLDQALAVAADKPVLSIQSTTNHLGGKRVCIEGPDVPWIGLLRERLARLEVTIVPEAGHFCMLEKPETVTDALLAFLAKLPA